MDIHFNIELLGKMNKVGLTKTNPGFGSPKKLSVKKNKMLE